MTMWTTNSSLSPESPESSMPVRRTTISNRNIPNRANIRIQEQQTQFDLNIPGARKAMEPGVGVIRRIFWVAITIACTAVTIYQVSERVKYFLSDPVLVTHEVVNGIPNTLPNIAICPVEFPARNENSSVHVDIPPSLMEEDIEQFVKEWRLIWSGMKCKSWDEKHSCNNVEIHFHVMGACYVIRTDQMGNDDEVLIGIKFTINTDLPWKLVLFNNETDSFDQLYQSSITIYKGRDVSLGIARKQILFHNSRTRKCLASDEYVKCRRDAEYRYFQEHLGCWLPFMGTTRGQRCQDWSKVRQFYASEAIFHSDNRTRHECHRGCQRDIYEVYMDKVIPQRRKGENENVKGLAYKDRLIKEITKNDLLPEGKGSQIEVYMATLNVEITTEHPLYSIFSLLADIGGNMGLFLGVCCLNIIDLVENLIKTVIKFMLRKKAQ